MKILDRYIGRVVAFGISVVMLVLLALYTFVALLGEMDRVGSGHYGIVAAIIYVLYTLPKRVYELFPVTALIGTLVSLGSLSASSELTAIRAAGVSIGRIGRSVMRVGAILMAAVVLVGEFIAPDMEQYATRERAIALGQQVAMKGRSGFWARDGDNFINIRRIHPGGRLSDLTIYQLDADHRLKTQTQATMATYYNGAWQLAGIMRREVSREGISTEYIPQATWQSLISPALLEVVMVRPDALSIVGLYHYIQYLQDNHLDASRYLQAMWTKLVDPVTTGVMILLALPFIFGPLRSVSLSQRVLAGFFVGISFHILNRAFHYIGQIYSLNPAFSACFPTLLFLGITLTWLKRVR
ncbi:lipopolysaccharide export system permease protein [Gammaproteobacteria bacterium]